MLKTRVHAFGGIEQNINMQILLFLKSFQQQIAIFCIDIPIEISQVIPVPTSDERAKNAIYNWLLANNHPPFSFRSRSKSILN